MALRRVLVGVIAIAATAGVYVAGAAWLAGPDGAVPSGIVSGNGRIEADQVDIAAKRAGRVREIAVAEGDMVRKGAFLAVLDMDELEADFDRAEAETALAREQRAEAEALVIQRRSELRLREHELERAVALMQRGHITEADFELRETNRNVAAAVLRAAEASVATAARRIAAFEAQARRIRTQIDDSRLTAPAAGRVLYRLAEPGEVVPAGQALLTLLSLENVYMEIFLPADAAARTPVGADARIRLDVLPDYTIPATVSFVSPEAQFTPKQVETLEERQKLVFRVRVRIPTELVQRRIAHVKTGVRGLAYVKLDAETPWPGALDRPIPPEFFE